MASKTPKKALHSMEKEHRCSENAKSRNTVKIKVSVTLNECGLQTPKIPLYSMKNVEVHQKVPENIQNT